METRVYKSRAERCLEGGVEEKKAKKDRRKTLENRSMSREKKCAFVL